MVARIQALAVQTAEGTRLYHVRTLAAFGLEKKAHHPHAIHMAIDTISTEHNYALIVNTTIVRPVIRRRRRCCRLCLRGRSTRCMELREYVGSVLQCRGIVRQQEQFCLRPSIQNRNTAG